VQLEQLLNDKEPSTGALDANRPSGAHHDSPMVTDGQSRISAHSSAELPPPRSPARRPAQSLTVRDVRKRRYRLIFVDAHPRVVVSELERTDTQRGLRLLRAIALGG